MVRTFSQSEGVINCHIYNKQILKIERISANIIHVENHRIPVISNFISFCFIYFYLYVICPKILSLHFNNLFVYNQFKGFPLRAKCFLRFKRQNNCFCQGTSPAFEFNCWSPCGMKNFLDETKNSFRCIDYLHSMPLAYRLFKKF